MRSAKDFLALTDPDPNARQSAIFKLGMKQNAASLAPFWKRLLSNEIRSPRVKELDPGCPLR